MHTVQESSCSTARETVAAGNSYCVEAPIDSKEAATLLGIHHKTIEKYAREGRIPAHRIGNKLWRFFQSELTASLRGATTLTSQSVRVN